VEFVGIVSNGKSLPFDLSHTLQAGDEYVPDNVLQVQVWLLVT
jgi:hypothetical protein